MAATRADDFDIARARRDTPGAARIVHLNNAGASLMPQPVLQRVIDHLTEETRAGGYEAAYAADGELTRVYELTGRLLNCRADEIALVENATRGWDMAFYSLSFTAGDRILTGACEYISNYLAYLQIARKTGARIEVIPNDETGATSPQALEAMIDEHVKLVAITHVPTNGGLVNDVAAIGRITRAHGIPYLVDACQSVGQMPVDVKAIGCDMLAGTGRKYLRGPRGTGFLYVRQGFLERMDPPFIDLRAAAWTGPDSYKLDPTAKRFETWENNVAGRLGFGAAVAYALDWGLPAIQHRISHLASSLRQMLAAIPGVDVRDLGREPCGIVSFTCEALNADTLAKTFQAEGINVSVSRASSTLLDMNARGLAEIVRASVHYYNTEDELRIFASRVASI